MTQVFSGTVLLPGETGDGLHASVEFNSGVVRLLAGDDEIGSWSEADCDVAPSGRGSFDLGLGGEHVMFTPTSPSSFAEAMSLPLQPQPSDAKKPKYDIDAAIDEAIANVKPLRNHHDHDELLSMPMLVGIVGTAIVLMAGLVGMTLVI